MQDSRIVGNTPLVKIAPKLWGKLETYNPTGSVKDRMAEFIFAEAKRRGELDGKKKIVEATSGNTGIAFARIAAINNLQAVIIMPCNMSEERKQMMRLYGAEIIEVGPSAFADAIALREDMVANDPECWSPRQFENQDNILCHCWTTGPEISQQTNGASLDAFVSGAGTGGTMMGVKKYFDRLHDRMGYKNPKFVLVVPAEPAAEHGIQGINDGADFLVDRSRMDFILEVGTQAALERAKRLARENGLLVGISAGANVLAAERWIEENNPEGIVVTMLCDRGERYLGLY